MVDRWQPDEAMRTGVLGREQARQRAAQLRTPPLDPPSHQARQTAALLTAAAYGPINAWCFVAPSTTGLGLWSRVALRAGQLVGEYGGPRLPLRLLRRGRSQSMVQVPGSDVAIDGACKCTR